MANISFDLAGFNNFIREAKINLSETDLSGLNTIFSECDTVSAVSYTHLTLPTILLV